MASEDIGVWKRLSRKATKHLLESLERGGPEVPELGAPGFQDGGHGAISAAPASDGRYHIINLPFFSKVRHNTLVIVVIRVAMHSPARSPLTSLPEGVMAKIVSLLDEDEKVCAFLPGPFATGKLPFYKRERSKNGLLGGAG